LKGDTASWSSWVGPGILVLLLFLLGFPSLSSYGVTWDEALGDLFFGERYLSFYTTFDTKYLDFGGEPYPRGHAPDLSVSPFRLQPWEHYPVANVLAAATSSVLSRQLGLLDPFDGFHAINLFLGAILIVALYGFTRRRFGQGAAVGAVLFLFLSPRVVCDLMANIKDFAEMVLFSLAVLQLWSALERGSARGVVAAGALWGLALGTKANALFLPAIPVLGLILGGLPGAWRGRRRTLVLASVAAVALGLAVVLAAWPYLWSDPLAHSAKVLRNIATQNIQLGATLTSPALQAILLTTPIPFLLLFLVGLVPMVGRAFRRDSAAILLLSWIAVVVLRLHLPGAVNFDGVRHFLEIFPPMAVIAGVGLAWAAALVARRFRASPSPDRTTGARPGPVAVAAVALAAATPLLLSAWSVLRSHPLESAYWNALAGGLPGARARGLPQAGDYWGASYRIGMRWLNEHAPRGALLAVPIVEHAVRLTAPQRLRPDIQLLPLTNPYVPQVDPDQMALLAEIARQRPVYVMFVWREDWMNLLTDDCRRRLAPDAEWRLEGAPVLSIYRYLRAS
jgi:hypothetical protein